MTRRQFTDPTAWHAIRAADRKPHLSRDRAFQLAAEAHRRGDLAGYERFMAAARRGDDQ